MLTNWAIRRNLEEIIDTKEKSFILKKDKTISVGELFQTGQKIDNEFFQIEKKYIEKMQKYLKGIKEIVVLEDFFGCDYIIELICEDDKDNVRLVYYVDGTIEGHDDIKEIKELVCEFMKLYAQRTKIRLQVESVSRNYIIRLNQKGMEIKLCNSIFEYLNKDLRLVIPYRNDSSKRMIKSKYGNTSITTNISKVNGILKTKKGDKCAIDSFLDHLQVYESDLPEKMQEEVKVFKKKLD